jgi:hypothetical protein
MHSLKCYLKNICAGMEAYREEVSLTSQKEMVGYSGKESQENKKREWRTIIHNREEWKWIVMAAKTLQ